MDDKLQVMKPAWCQFFWVILYEKRLSIPKKTEKKTFRTLKNSPSFKKLYYFQLQCYMISFIYPQWKVPPLAWL